MTRKRFILSFVAVSFWRNSKNMGTLLFQLSLIGKPKKQPYKIHIKVKDFVNYWNIEIGELLWCINKFFCYVAAARTSYLLSKTYHKVNWHLQKHEILSLFFKFNDTMHKPWWISNASIHSIQFIFQFIFFVFLSKSFFTNGIG